MSSIFLSHNYADKRFVRRLAQDLRAEGVRVWFDEAELQIGDSLIEKIRQGIDEMEYLGVILSPNSVQSSWVQREVDIAMNQEIKGKCVKVLPFVIAECELPGFLEGKFYADFRNRRQYKKELMKILRRLGRGEAPRYGVPSQRTVQAVRTQKVTSKMATGWTGKRLYQKLQNELAIRSADDFERYALHLLRFIWSGVVGTPRRRAFDRKGTDHLVWSDYPPFPVVVQCKGWEVLEDQLGADQVSQCIQSIESFRHGGLKAEKYILVHNRIGIKEAFRKPIQDQLGTLVASGQVKEAELWSRQQIVKEAFQCFYERCILEIAHMNLNSFHTFQDLEQIRWEAIETVPLQSNILLADQYRLVDFKKGRIRVSDPCKELLSSNETISVLIGRAGFGKSTTAFRLSTLAGRKAIYIPAAMITKEAVNTTDFLKQAISVEEMLAEFLPEDFPIHKEMALFVVSEILRLQDTNMLLIIDGLDESIYFNKKGGIQELLNLIENIKIPTVLTARSEYWYRKESDFSTAFGIVSNAASKKRKIRLVELQEWSDDKILELLSKVISKKIKKAQLSRLNDLRNLIENGKYIDFYGDIPRRPLFLKFIIDTVLERDPHKVNRAQLFYEWICQKIFRDISNPARFQGVCLSNCAPRRLDQGLWDREL